MSTVFIQLDEGYGLSFIWSKDICTLRNLMLSFDESLISFGIEEDGTYSLAYKTEYFQDINSLCVAVFDELVVVTNDIGDSGSFVKYCKEILCGK